MKRAYIVHAPLPPPEAKLTPTPALFVNVQPETVNVPFAGAPTPLPIVLLSLAITSSANAAFPDNVTPVNDPVLMAAKFFNWIRNPVPLTLLLYEPFVTVK